MNQVIKRCAIYTRKSSEEGLEQEFNSLDAQRESCAAYIASQKHDGWQIIKTAYDDGGFTGGNMERPGLRQLLADITDGKIDVVVVYKIDRLTRSLFDFAKMVETFDKHNVSFVSVTQQFNTTTPMGRLTLNVLLSFAQFEREVTGERIRDKIAASKKKGMWMGGFVPLGYDAVDRKLVINNQEAETVKSIFEKYLELGCVRLLKDELDNKSIINKSRIKDDGTVVEGKSISRGCLYKILSNPIYIGKIRHKESVYEGQHDPIINPEVWQQVQQSLSGKAVKSGENRKTESSIFIGKIFDESGNQLTPSHANKKGRRYRYYISKHLTTGKSDKNQQNWRLPAQEIEQTILQIAKNILNDRIAITTAISDSSIPAHHIPVILSSASELSKRSDDTDAVTKLIDRVELKPDGITITISLKTLIENTVKASSAPLIITKNIPIQMKRRGVEMRLVIDNNSGIPDQTLIKTIARTRKWFDDLASGKVKSISAIAEGLGVGLSYVSNSLPLAFLAPEVVEAIISGRQPVDLTADTLIKKIKLPLQWSEQERIFNL